MTDLSHAHAQAQAGMDAAMDHAQREDPRFATVAFMWIHRYARSHREFKAEDCIAAAVEWGLSVPVKKAFGGIFQRAARAKMITKAGYVPSKNRHGAATPLWRSNVYREPQC